MAGYGDLFAQAFMSAADKKKEAETKAALMQWQTNLENQTLTPEEKLMRMYRDNPSLVRGFFEAKSPFTPQEIALRRMGLDLQQQGINIDRANSWYRNNQENMGPHQRDFEYLRGLNLVNPQTSKPMTDADLLPYVFRNPSGQDDMMMMMQMLMNKPQAPK